ncbi:hypothetical protein VCUG_00935 [Vavraia culicis subsp. floridensis]|uniref:Uncharacterized protein n=1 Tax=Vavraia culicis (isolate floridensis) TaxID=948595 RepID=L2GW68_VAVCU|nr:uncharacterized protein VCUG_00935 [Vavraia culicis subsp. floridensis]ELA47612.1 hypothetical protein VCUG_00935 [Vavraia culicis subsp. floridensis]
MLIGSFRLIAAHATYSTVHALLRIATQTSKSHISTEAQTKKYIQPKATRASSVLMYDQLPTIFTTDHLSSHSSFACTVLSLFILCYGVSNCCTDRSPTEGYTMFYNYFLDQEP